MSPCVIDLTDGRLSTDQAVSFPSVTVTLASLDGDLDRVFVLDNETKSVEIGRASKSRLRGMVPDNGNGWIESPIVSRKHAKLSIELAEDKALYVTDQGSTHGTKMNGRALAKDKKVHMSTGDILTFGSSIICGANTFRAKKFEVNCRWERSRQPSASMPTPAASPHEVGITRTFSVPDEDSEESAVEAGPQKKSVSSPPKASDALVNEKTPSKTNERRPSDYGHQEDVIIVSESKVHHSVSLDSPKHTAPGNSEPVTISENIQENRRGLEYEKDTLRSNPPVSAYVADSASDSEDEGPESLPIDRRQPGEIGKGILPCHDHQTTVEPSATNDKSERSGSSSSEPSSPVYSPDSPDLLPDRSMDSDGGESNEEGSLNEEHLHEARPSSIEPGDGSATGAIEDAAYYDEGDDNAEVDYPPSPSADDDVSESEEEREHATDGSDSSDNEDPEHAESPDVLFDAETAKSRISVFNTRAHVEDIDYSLSSHRPTNGAELPHGSGSCYVADYAPMSKDEQRKEEAPSHGNIYPVTEPGPLYQAPQLFFGRGIQTELRAPSPSDAAMARANAPSSYYPPGMRLDRPSQDIWSEASHYGEHDMSRQRALDLPSLSNQDMLPPEWIIPTEDPFGIRDASDPRIEFKLTHGLNGHDHCYPDYRGGDQLVDIEIGRAAQPSNFAFNAALEGKGKGSDAVQDHPSRPKPSKVLISQIVNETSDAFEQRPSGLKRKAEAISTEASKQSAMVEIGIKPIEAPSMITNDCQTKTICNEDFEAFSDRLIDGILPKARPRNDLFSSIDADSRDKAETQKTLGAHEASIPDEDLRARKRVKRFHISRPAFKSFASGCVAGAVAALGVAVTLLATMPLDVQEEALREF